MARFVLDYIEETVGSRLINTCVFIAILGPLFHFIYIIQTQLNESYPPLFYMLSWFLLPSICCLLLLTPMQFGNNYFEKHSISSTLISITWCLLVFGYEAYSCFVLIQFSNIAWFYFICLCASAFCSIIASFYYIFMLLTKASYLTYAKEKTEEYKHMFPSNEFEDDGNENLTETIQSQTSQKQYGFFSLFLEFLWPSIPMQFVGNDTIFYPSRIAVTVFLSVCGVIGCNELLIYYYLYTAQQLDVLLSYIDSLHSVLDNHTIIANNFQNIEASISWSLHIANSIYFFAKPISDALLVGSIVGLICGIYGSYMITRAWKKRVVCMRYGYNIDGSKWTDFESKQYPLWWSAKFVSSTACCVVFGSMLIAVLTAIVYGLASCVDMWSLFVDSGMWRYIACYIGYYVFEWFIFQYLLMTVWFKGKMDNKWCSLVLVINDLTYIPLAALFCIIRIFQSILICLISFIRPDLSIFPGYLANFDHAHLAFVSSVRLSVEFEKNLFGFGIKEEEEIEMI